MLLVWNVDHDVIFLLDHYGTPLCIKIQDDLFNSKFPMTDPPSDTENDVNDEDVHSE